MILPTVIRQVHPHYIDYTALIYSKGNRVYKANIPKLDQGVELGTFYAGMIKHIGSRFDLVKRAGRLGFHDLKPFKKWYIGVQHKAIVWKGQDEKKFNTVFHSFRGSRPLGLFVHPVKEKIYFGEYFGNENREEVYIYASDNAMDWDIAWTFEAGSIRHVHGITWDNYRQGMWVQTGDSNQESGLWFTNDDFKTLTKVVSGSQKARAVEIIPVNGGLIVPMDSPLEKNYINRYDIQSKQFQPLTPLPGSAFHAIRSNGIYLVSTVTEPSEVNQVDYASVWASLDGEKWKEISRFEKDWVPIKYQFIGRYTEVYFPDGPNTSDYIIGYGQAIKGMSNCMLVWEKAILVDFLKN